MIDILGTNLAFPLVLDDKGELELVSGAEGIKQDIIDILTTKLGTRPFLGQYGSRIHELRNILNANILRSIATSYIYEALLQEKRIRFNSVEIEQQDSRFSAVVYYTIIASTKTDSVIVPFYNEIPA
jgi:phage baseplate assembly protein W